MAEIGKKFCVNCGAEIDDKAEICPKCGVRQMAIDRKSKMAAVLLAWFLGGIGIHRLYLKQSFWWLYLLLCWTLVPALIAFFDGLQYLLMSQADFDAKYN